MTMPEIRPPRYRWTPPIHCQMGNFIDESRCGYDHARYSGRMSSKLGWNDNIALKHRVFFKHKMGYILWMCTICVVISIVRRKDPCAYKIISDTLKKEQRSGYLLGGGVRKRKKNCEEGWHVSLKGWVSGVVGFLY